MDNTQLYLAVGIPGVLAVLGVLINTALFVAINSRMSALEARQGALEGKVDSRIGALEAKFDSRFDLLMGKLFEMDNRLSRVEERLKMG